MIDVGLTAGVRTLWQNASLQDYTLKVEDQEFQVHKVVLAAVSNFFQAMLCDSFVESNTDSVELKGQSADAVSRLLEFVYTGEETLLNKTDNVLEVLKCAMYLQIPPVIEFCAKKLSENISPENCLETLSVLSEYSLHKEVEEVQNFIKHNWKAVFQNCRPEDMSTYELQTIIDNWQKSEWDMFLFIKDRYTSDPENCKDDVNDLLTQVRFCIIPPEDVESIKEMDIFCNTEGSWHELVENALVYHRMPMHMRVLEKSEQVKLKAGPSPVIFSPGYQDKYPAAFCTLDKDSKWRRYELKGENVPQFSDRCICIAVNDFLVVARWGEFQYDKWLLFDPKTLTWSLMANMVQSKAYFALAQHGDHLYAIGGNTIADGPTDWLGCRPLTPTNDVSEYSFRTNTWTTSTRNLPKYLAWPGACVHGDKLYVAGGKTYESNTPDSRSEPSDRLYCNDLSIRSNQWESKAIMPWGGIPHNLCEMKIDNEDVLLFIGSVQHLQYYSLTTDQWFTLKTPHTYEHFDMGMIDHIMILPIRNSVYILNVCEPVGSGLVFSVRWVCWIWTVPEAEGEITEVVINDFAVSSSEWNEGLWGGCSAISALPCEMYH